MKPTFLRLIQFALIAFGMIATKAQPSGVPPGPPPGVLVDIAGHKLHMRCAGPEGTGPTVIFESGGGGTSKDWKAVQAILSPHVRSCAYDRAGSGWSEAGPGPRTMKQEVFELHELLQRARVPGPYILVGQSIGGLLARLYSDKYGSNVVGVVLVDPTHESSVLGNARYGGWVRLREKATGRIVPEPRLEGKPSKEYNPDDDYMAEEFQLMFLSRQANPEPLGDRPLIVLGAGRRPAPPGTSEEVWKKLREEKEEQVKGQAQLSRNSKFVRDPASGHNIQADNPKLVAQAIEEVLEAVQRKTKLAH